FRTLPTETPGTLSGLLDQRDRFVLRQNDFAGNRDLTYLLLIRDLIHQIEHEIFDNHAQPARADLPLERRLRDSVERVVREAKLHVLVLEKLHVLTGNRVARLRENLDERRLVELVQRPDDRKAPDELGDEAVLDQIRRFELLEGRADVASPNRLD